MTTAASDVPHVNVPPATALPFASTNVALSWEVAPRAFRFTVPGVTATPEGSPATAVAVNTSGPRFGIVAVTVCWPAVGPKVHAVDAVPSAAVVDDGGFAVPPPVVTAQVIWISQEAAVLVRYNHGDAEWQRRARHGRLGVARS